MLKKTITLFVFFILVACGRSNALQGVEGEQINLNQAKGKWVILNYWASWCEPCAEEIPELNAFYAAHRKDAVVIGVNYEQVSREQLKTLVEHLAIHYPVLEKELSGFLGVTDVSALPTTFLIDPNGQLHAPIFGMQTKHSLEILTGLEKKHE
jgi:thiol-disulfide isomerase/thioredoxin